jgi:hypothetical protein
MTYLTHERKQYRNVRNEPQGTQGKSETTVSLASFAIPLHTLRSGFFFL